jgi:hypothetical protein
MAAQACVTPAPDAGHPMGQAGDDAGKGERAQDHQK